MEELWNAIRRSHQEPLAPLILSHGIRSLSDFAVRAEELLQSGVAQWNIEAVLAAGAVSQPTIPAPARADLPAPFHGKRASLVSALEAAKPNQRQRSMASLDRDILARSTNPSQEARVRTYMAICAAWEIPPFPISHNSIRCFGASLKAGGYRSAAVYYQAICSHQNRALHCQVEPILRWTIRDCIRSILRGLGVQKLKDSFNGLRLADVAVSHDDSPFDFDNLAHIRDMCVLGLWYMLRESEMASAKLSHLTLDATEVRLLIPIHKTDCYGGLCERVLACSCRLRQHSLCVWHAAERHLIRCDARRGTVESNRFPLFPTRAGLVASKQQFISAFRQVIAATGTPLERHDPNGKSIARFHGHVLRVSGAQLLFTAGVHLQLIQLLGRWTSLTILRYTQEAGLNLVPGIPDVVLNQAPDVQSFNIANAVPLAPSGQGGAGSSAPAPPVMQSRAASAATGPRPEPPGVPPPVVDPQELQAIQAELRQLRQLITVREVRQVYVVRTRSKIVHLGSQHELSNIPAQWRTRCGWPYGQANFFRISEIHTPLRRCKKCFDLEDSSGSDDPESGSGFSDLRASDDSEDSA